MEKVRKVRRYALWLTGIIVAVFFLQIVFPPLTQNFRLVSADVWSKPWTLLTAIFLHGSVIHLLYNGFGLAVFGSVLALWVFYRFQRYLPATRAAIIYSLEPVFAAGMAWFFIGEPMTLRKIGGGAIIIVANLICESGTRPSRS